MKNSIIVQISSTFFLGTALLFPENSPASTPALSLNPGEEQPVVAPANVSVGWAFTVETPIEVTSLGIYDADSDGLAEAHAVAIWNELTGGVEISDTVPAGSKGELVDGFRYVAVENQVLAPGTYVIAAYYEAGSPDTHFPRVESAITDPSLRYVGGRYEPYDELVKPTFPGTGTGIFGPNFQMISQSPATIVKHPSSLFAYVGSNAVFQVEAVGAPPLDYQWRHGSVSLEGATNSTLTLTNVQLSDAGEYTVVVSNEFGSATSDPAQLEVSFLQVARYVGVILLGNPGDEFRIDYKIDLNMPTWIPLTNITLTTGSYTWIDLDSRFEQHRLYRGVLLSSP